MAKNLSFPIQAFFIMRTFCILVIILLAVVVSGCTNQSSVKRPSSVEHETHNDSNNSIIASKPTKGEKNLLNKKITDEKPLNAKLVEIDSSDFNEIIVNRKNQSLSFFNTMNNTGSRDKSIEIQVDGGEYQKIYPNQYYTVSRERLNSYKIKSEWTSKTGGGLIVPHNRISEMSSNNPIKQRGASNSPEINITGLYKWQGNVKFTIKNTDSVPINLDNRSNLVLIAGYVEHVTESGIKVNRNAFRHDLEIDNNWNFSSSYYDVSPKRERPKVWEPNESVYIEADLSYPRTMESRVGEISERRRFTVIGPEGSKASKTCEAFYYIHNCP